MQINNKKTVSVYNRRPLTVVRDFPRLTKVIEKEAEPAVYPYSIWKMPDQQTGYIKNKKHDCL